MVGADRPVIRGVFVLGGFGIAYLTAARLLGVGEATAKAVVASIVAIFAADYVTTTLMTEL